MLKLYNIKNNKILRQKLRNKPTKAEIVLWSKLKNNQLNYKFRRQQGIGKYIVDFYCPELKLIIELDGITYLTDGQFEKDLARQNYLENNGHVVKRYSDELVLNNLDDVLRGLYHTCGLISGRCDML